MSSVQIIETRDTTYALGGRYVIAEMECGSHHATVMIAPHYLQVIVHNASNRAWRGMGRRFNTVADALAAYKTAEVRAMIETAQQVAA